MANPEQQSKGEGRKQSFLAMAGLIGAFGPGPSQAQSVKNLS